MNTLHTHTDDAYYKTCPGCNPQPDKITAGELRQQFADLHTEIEALRTDLLTLRDGLTQAASKPAASETKYQDFDASQIVMTYDDNGKAAYKIKGAPFLKFGVRVWDEVLPELGIDPASLKPGPNPIQIRVRALMFEATSEAGTVSTQPKKIIGKA